MVDSVGAAVSTTVTVNAPVVVRPPPSVTVQLTVVAPSSKKDGLAAEHVGVGSGSSSASVALAANRTEAPPGASP